jgi:uncharacterized membrane protein YoaK (UPF0700 family)
MAGWKVVIERDGRSREVLGRRRWAIAVPVLALVAPVVAVAVLFAFGLVLTISAVLMVAVPVALVLALIGLVFGRYEIRKNAD